MRPLILLLLLVAAVTGVLFAAYMLTGTGTDSPGLGGVASTDSGGSGEDPGPDRPETPVQAPGTGQRTTPDRVGVDDGGTRTSTAPTGQENSLVGLVVDTAEQPLSGATVVLTKSTGEAAFFATGPRDPSQDVTVTTDAEGRYRFRSVPPFEHYGLIARHPSFSRVEVNGVQVGEGETVGPTIRMRTGATIYGQVSDETGGPIANATLRLQTRMLYTHGQTDPDMVETLSDQSGRYEFKNVSEVYNFLAASADGFGNVTMRSVQPRGRAKQEVNVILKTAEMIGGLVLGRGDSPVEGANVMAMKPDGNNRSCYDQVVTDAEGRFVLERLEAGPYSLAIRADGYKHHAEQRIETGEMGLTVRLTSQATVSGRVLDGTTGEPVSIGTCRLRRVHPQTTVSSPTEIRTSFQNPDGKYELANVRKGTYVVEGEAPGFAPTPSQEFTVTEGQNLPGIDVRLKRGGIVVGRVVNASGQPVVGARITSHDDTWTEDAFTLAMGDLFPTLATSRTASSRSDGTFRLENLNPYTYQIRVRAGGYSTFLRRGVKVGEGEKAIGDVALLRGGTVTGIVRDGSGKPVSGADLQMTLIPTGTGVLPMVFKAKSGGDGVYTIANVNAGNYRLRATVRSDTAAGQIDPLAIQSTTLEIVVREGQVIKQDVSTGR